jgi:hypothetical protein
MLNFILFPNKSETHICLNIFLEICGVLAFREMVLDNIDMFPMQLLFPFSLI